MKTIRIALLAAALTVIGGVPGLTQSGQDLLQQALVKEQADGDLRAAIAIYQRIVRDFAGDRVLAAKALMQLGRCHEKLGDAEAREARKAYERVVREFGDQTAMAAEARARLAALAASPATYKPELAVRRIWSWDADLSGSASSDGRLMAITDWSTGNIAIRNLATGEMRRLTKTGELPKSPVFGQAAKFSPDDRQVAYAWTDTGSQFSLRVIGADGSGLRTLCSESNVNVIPATWTPDGKSIVATVNRTDEAGRITSTQIATVSSESGALRTLTSSGRIGPSGISVSPDGRFLVYAQAQADGKPDIFAISLQDGREAKLVEHPAADTSPIWTPDGRRVLFVSDRTGSAGLWAQEVVDGQAFAPPELVRSETGTISPMGFTTSGVLIFGVTTRVSDVFVATFDLQAGRFLDKPVPVSQRIAAGRSLASWSPDGKHLAFLTRPPGNTITIRTIASGDERDIPFDAAAVRSLEWFADGTALVVSGLDNRRRGSVFRVDVRSGAVSSILRREDMTASKASVTSDGRSLLYLGYRRGGGSAVVIRDLQTGQERIIAESPSATGMAVSPDGKLIAVTTLADGREALAVMPVAGGARREIYQAERERSIHGAGSPIWTPDGSRLLCSVMFQDNVELLLVPVGGGEPVKMRAPMTGLTNVSFHPDGRRVAFAAGQERDDLWVMENFLPAARPTTAAAAQKIKK